MARTIKIDNAQLKRCKRASQKRKSKPVGFRVLIVCEGKKTEPNYFEAFRKINNGVFVIDMEVDGGGINTVGVVHKAIRLRDNAMVEYDRVWAVFDKDSFPDANFNSAIIKAKKNNICCAWSNEAFELWYLYHFQNRVTAMKRQDYKDAISKAVNESPKYKKKTPFVYQKNDAYGDGTTNYDIMTKYGSMDNAIQWAEAKSSEYDDEKFAKHNPCTMVFKLVKQLLGKDDELNDEIKRKVDE